MSLLRRYEPIVDDPDAFLEAAERPLPRVVWANPLLLDPERTAELVRRRCPDAEPVRWLDWAWRLPLDEKSGRWPEHALGLVHTQEEVTLWPVRVLDPQPGEQVLDLCAAPGNKTADVAGAMGDRGCVVGNDSDTRRLPALRDVLIRLGVTCGVITRADGRELPGEALYDRVLVDAPCTAEGTSRKSGGHIRTLNRHERPRMARIQRGLLRTALRLVRPGGIVVYATCTYGPEENEAVVSSIPEDEAVVEPVEAREGLHVAPGVTSWREWTYRPDVAHAGRLWPHHNDTGGFFVARLRRL